MKMWSSNKYRNEEKSGPVEEQLYKKNLTIQQI
jgi:hypothetical protein